MRKVLICKFLLPSGHQLSGFEAVMGISSAALKKVRLSFH